MHESEFSSKSDKKRTVYAQPYSMCRQTAIICSTEPRIRFIYRKLLFKILDHHTDFPAKADYMEKTIWLCAQKKTVYSEKATWELGLRLRLNALCKQHTLVPHPNAIRAHSQQTTHTVICTQSFVYSNQTLVPFNFQEWLKSLYVHTSTMKWQKHYSRMRS